jgi:hypothetical protein
MMPRGGRGFAVLVIALIGAVSGCAGGGKPQAVDVQRATGGPTSDDVAVARFVRDYGRAPTFEERTALKEATESRIFRYFAQRPDVASSPRASQLRFRQAVVVGMSKEEVLLLLEQSDSVTSDAAAMSAAAGTFWPAISKRAKEMWTYPPAWRLYFDGDVLVDVTVAGAPPLE